MDFLINLFLAFHIIGIAALLGGFLAQTKLLKAGQARISPGMLHGALTMLVTGLALVGLNEAGDGEVNHVKVTVKLGILATLTTFAYLRRNDERVPAGIFGAIGLLTTVNIFLATLW
ncbi:hypothetical protein PJ985_07385 [Streptomyces sp. ACA25]|uniref:hypothetical protein n=1 Tax=Streptomyces sp. ACA25 TaxID=3022596 RepID=UPI0023077A53|nr:hypothetical protein [Streptomyces sp. ACA25]MDB1087385.1 hypothetical protein [Streptomyces sp. ACA25]